MTEPYFPQPQPQPQPHQPVAEPETTSAPRRRFVLWAWIPYVLLAGFAGYWAATHWGAVVSGARSIKAIGFGAAAVVLAALLLFGIARLTRRGWAGQLAGLVPLVAAVVIAVLPSYLTTTVNDEAPDGLVAAGSSSEPSTTEPAPTAEPTQPGGIAVGGGPADTPTTTAAPTTTQAPTGPVELGTASFVGIDHDATGTVRLIQLEDGSQLVRFESFEVEPGPDYDVYVLMGDNVMKPGGGIGLGDLRGTSGDQNYNLAAGSVSGGQTVTVLIWCELFDVPVANATLTL